MTAADMPVPPAHADRARDVAKQARRAAADAARIGRTDVRLATLALLHAELTAALDSVRDARDAAVAAHAAVAGPGRAARIARITPARASQITIAQKEQNP